MAQRARSSFEQEKGRAAIWEIDPATGRHRIFASGVRNPVGMTWEPERGALWAAVNERDELGRDLLVADDVGNVVWRVTGAPGGRRPSGVLIRIAPGANPVHDPAVRR